MKFEIKVDDNLDLSTFRSMLFSFLEKDQATYDLLIDDVIVRVIAYKYAFAAEGMVQIGLFESRLSSAPMRQIHPLQDIRFANLSIMKDYFGSTNWCKIVCLDQQKVFSIIEQIVKSVCKVQKLKVFL